jgi:hypothetical protein
MRAAYESGHSSGYAKGFAEAKTPVRIISWLAVARDLLENYNHFLTEWERGFFDSFIERRWNSPTPKQRAIFERVADKTGINLPPG